MIVRKVLVVGMAMIHVVVMVVGSAMEGHININIFCVYPILIHMRSQRIAYIRYSIRRPEQTSVFRKGERSRILRRGALDPHA
jgi:hypothetical protein